MQQIERYGVIALVFFLVTIVAVSFWGDSKSPGFWSRLTGRTAKPESSAASLVPPPATSDVALQSPLPLNTEPANPGAQASMVVPGGEVAPVVPVAADAGALVQTPPVLTPPAAGPGLNLPASAPASTSTPREYVVQRGDSLANIAQRQLGKESRWSEIAALNPGLNPKNLKVGATLVMPGDAAPAVAKAPASPARVASNEPAPKPKSSKAPEKKSGARSYKVQKGDTLKAIARRELGAESRWKEIAALNPGLDANRMAIGQTLRLPGGESSSRPEVASLATQASHKPQVR